MTATAVTAMCPGREAARRLGAPLPWVPSLGWEAEAERAMLAAQKGARARTLDMGDVGSLMGIYADAVQLCSAMLWRPMSIVAECHGGAVAKSYPGKAEATWGRINAGTGITFRRDRARRDKRGQSWTFRLTLAADVGLPPKSEIILDGIVGRIMRHHDDCTTLAWWW